MVSLNCRNWRVLATLGLALTGCQREASAPSPVPDPVAAAVGAGATSDFPVADSALTIKHGTAALTTDTRTLRLCGETEDLWIVDQGSEGLEENYARLVGEPGAPLYVEVRGERTATPAGTSIPQGFSHAFLLEELLYAGVPAAGGGCAAASPAYRAQARGNEPFWAVEILADKMQLHQPDLPAPLVFPLQESQDAEGSVTYHATSSGHTLELTITNTGCIDSMSGEFFAFTAQARLDGRDHQGCARLGD